MSKRSRARARGSSSATARGAHRLDQQVTTCCLFCKFDTVANANNTHKQTHSSTRPPNGKAPTVPPALAPLTQMRSPCRSSAG